MSKGLGIRGWAAADRPRERLIEQGRRALSDVELLAIVIGGGTAGASAMALSQRILADLDNSVYALSKVDIQELSAYRGIGQARAVRIIAALELGRRRQGSNPRVQPVLQSSKQVYEYFRNHMQDLWHEEFWVIYVNTAGRVLQRQLIGRGGNDFTPVDVRTILRHALHAKAHAMILLHNHPSGSMSASKADIQLTHKVVAAAKLMDFRVNDHIIFTDHGYYSFTDQGIMPL